MSSKYKLGQLLEIKYGKDHKKLLEGTIPVYGSGGIIRYVDKYLYNEESILIPRKGTLTNLFYINEPFWTVDTIFWSKINHNLVEGKFLFYYLKTIDFAGLNVGSAVPSLTTKILNEISINLPSFKQQQKIASILSSLDDKIELNNKMNQTLEKMAQTIFKEWFEEFNFPNAEGKPYKTNGGAMHPSELGEIPEGWEVKEFKNIINLFSGKRPPVKKDVQSIEYNIPIVGASKIMGYTNSVLLNEKVLIIGRVGTLGVVQKYDYEIWVSDNTLIFRTKYYEYVNQVLKKINYMSLNRGSTQPLITQGDINQIKTLIPKSNILEKFESLMKPFFKQIKQNQQQTQTLTKLRDTLLPKLMSGEIKV